MARKLETICSDGVLYLRVAEAIERGSLERADGRSRANRTLSAGPLPAASGRVSTGKPGSNVWGVLLSTLAVLPLFGWLRRQFDDRVAFVACLLYAVHPKLIEWSPEAVRDPTFWFFFTLSLYLLWRGAEEVDWRRYLAAGLILPLCALTRFEGWFLLFPLVGWSLVRFRWLEAGRGRLVAGAVLCFAALPVVPYCFGKLLPPEASCSYLRIEPLERRRRLARRQTSAPRGCGASLLGTAVGSPCRSGRRGQRRVDRAGRGRSRRTLCGAGATPTPRSRKPATGHAAGRSVQMLHTFERGLTPLFAISCLAVTSPTSAV